MTAASDLHNLNVRLSGLETRLTAAELAHTRLADELEARVGRLEARLADLEDGPERWRDYSWDGGD